MIKILHGVKKIGDNIYQYDYWEVLGLDPLDSTINRSKFIQEVFTALPTETPEIGDFIAAGRLVKREGYQITEGKMKWPSDNSYIANGWEEM